MLSAVENAHYFRGYLVICGIPTVLGRVLSAVKNVHYCRGIFSTVWDTNSAVKSVKSCEECSLL